MKQLKFQIFLLAIFGQGKLPQNNIPLYSFRIWPADSFSVRPAAIYLFTSPARSGGKQTNKRTNNERVEPAISTKTSY